MKLTRQKRIREIIGKYEIETQEELTNSLKEMGIQVTQATVSRDIKEMLLVKIPCGDGRYKYASPEEKSAKQTEGRMSKVFRDTVEFVDFSENIVVVKTLPGGAGAVAHAIDKADWDEIIGTIAGDDTIMVVVKPKEMAEVVVDRFMELQHSKRR